MVSTQASQLRLTQRQNDTGWIEAAAVLEREDSLGANTWSPVECQILSSVLSVNSRAVSYNAIFKRTANWRAVPYRVYLGSTLLEVTEPQRAGEMHIIKPDGATYTYQLEYTMEGYLQPIMMYQQKWQFGQTLDRYQIAANFNIV